eukprot:scaffold35432_cov27-Tisochrysis_lutea.AAC.5
MAVGLTTPAVARAVAVGGRSGRSPNTGSGAPSAASRIVDREAALATSSRVSEKQLSGEGGSILFARVRGVLTCCGDRQVIGRCT